jgi:predicted CoA-binding protein
MLNQPKDILKTINSIAIVGISSNEDKDSNKVMRFLINKGYKVFPVNPNEEGKYILGRKCFRSLSDINHEVDMVDVFRKKEFVYDITKEAIKINAKVLWTQLGIFCEDSFSLAKDAGLNVVMNKCPIIELVD